MTCIDCNNLKSHGATGQQMARQGFGGCKKQPAYRFHSLTLERECGMFEQAPAEKVQQRREWMK